MLAVRRIESTMRDVCTWQARGDATTCREHFPRDEKKVIMHNAMQ